MSGDLYYLGVEHSVQDTEVLLIQIFLNLLNPDALSLNPGPSLNIGMDAAQKGSLGLQV